jgi:TolB-like protein/Tfp pilus assembly protein PilF
MPNEMPPSSSSPDVEDAAGGRLDSWKDIAAFLKRDVSTVQRWEKREQMPVHRHVHDKLGTVYGFRAELNAWMRGRGSNLGEPQAGVLDEQLIATENKSQPDVTVSPEPEVHTRARHAFWTRRLLTLASIVAVGLGTAISYVWVFSRTANTGTPAIESLAVLPLDNLSDDPAQEYVSDGMTTALITELGKIGSLRVIAGTSVMKYKGTHAPPSQVARELGVQVLVAGSVLRSGDRVRITAQLIDPSSDRQTWSEVYERDLRDVLQLQREVVLAIAGKVRARLTPAEQARLSKLRPVNPEAYEAVLRARYLSFRTTDADNRAAIALLEHAVALDPDLAPAYADLAAADVTRLSFVKPDETRELEQKAFAAAEKALSLDPDLPEAYLARGDLLWTHSHRFAHVRAAQEFRRALSLNANSDQAHRRLARVYVHIGFFEEALQHAAIALAINPTNAQALNSRAQALLWMGKDEDALTNLMSIPGPVLPELVEANTVFVLLRLGRREEARSHLQAALQKYPNDATGNLAGIEAMLAAESEPLKALALIETVAQRKAVNPAHHAAYFAACACARMRRVEEAVHWLREAAETGFPCYPLFEKDANLDPIRQDVRFQTFMADLRKQWLSLQKALFPDRK